jgi:hypothetical protein
LKPETKYSLFIFGLSVIWKTSLLLSGLVETAIGDFPVLPVFAFLLIGMFRGMEERRKLDFSNGVSFLPIFKSGASIATLFTLLYTLFLYFYLNFLDVAFKARFIADRVEDLKKKQTTPENIEAWVKSAQTFPFSSSWLLFTFIGLMLIGLIYAFAITRMMVKKHPIKA